MFSRDPRCLLQKNQLAEVICQLRFPDILMIGAQAPIQLQEAIRQDFPQYSVQKEAVAPKITGAPGNLTLEEQPVITNYQFASEDGSWRINLTSNFISLSCNRYTCWEEFAGHLDQPLAAFIQIYKPAYFQRVGLRYLNFISRKELGLSDFQYRDLIQNPYLGILCEEDVDALSVSRSTVDTELIIRGGCRVKIHAGPGMIKRNGTAEKEARFIFDQDLFMPGNVPVNHSAGALETLHSQAYGIFRGAITDTLFQAMQPCDL